MNKFRTLENIIRDVAAGKQAGTRYTVLESAIRKVLGSKGKPWIENDESDQIAAGSYMTKNFEMGGRPAQMLFTHLPKGTDPALAEKSAIAQDQLFALQKQVMAKQRADHADIMDAENIAKQIKHFAKQMNLEKEHSYIDDNVNKIKSLYSPEGNIVKADKLDLDLERNRMMSPPTEPTPEKKDNDIDNTKFLLSRNLKAQRKLKIIDND